MHILTALRLWGLITLGLHIFAYFVSEALLWSTWSYTFFPFWLGSLLAVGAALTIIPAYNEQGQTFFAWLWHKTPAKAWSQSWFISLALLSLPIFWLARIRHLNWGDAQILVIGLSHPDQTVIYNWQAPLTVFLHQRIWALAAQPLWGWGVDTVYAVISVLCGGLFVYVLLNLARQLGRDSLERILIAGFVLTSGAIQLFFGYVENYTILSLGLLLFLWVGLQVLQGKRSLWVAVLTLAVANAFHPSTVFLWPAALYLAWICCKRGLAHSQVILELILPPLIVSNSVLTLMELGDHGLSAFLGDDRPGGGDHRWFVPLFSLETDFERYTMFSGLHLLAWANEHFLIAPFGLFTICTVGVWTLLTPRQQSQYTATETNGQGWFLGIGSINYLLLTWVWNADYGVRKDWDLFSPSAFVYTVFAAYLLTRTLKNRQRLAHATLLILTISALHTASWIYANMHPLTHHLGE